MNADINPEKTPLFTANVEAEIATLIRTLHQTEQRIELLTAGEVDTVTDADGRTLLLHRAQQQMRRAQESRQAMLLNALPAHIALLDGQGIIVAVNDAWTHFSSHHVLQGGGYKPGTHYLNLCSKARGDGAAEAVHLAEAIRSILIGTSSSFSVEYPCVELRDKGAPMRWFLVTVTPLTISLSLADSSLAQTPNEKACGAVIVHQDITAERQAKQDLKNSEWRFRQMAENIRDVFFLADAHSNGILYISPAYETIWGRSCASLYAEPQSWLDAIHPDDQVSTIEKYRRGSLTGKFEYEYRIVRPDNTIRWMEMRASPIRDDGGKLVRIAGIVADITERKKAEARIAYLNRVYVMLSNINILIVRVDNRHELYHEACRIAVEGGGFRMSLIALVDEHSLQVRPVASMGIDAELLLNIGTLLLSEDAPNTMIQRAVDGKKAVVANNSQSDPQVLIGLKHSELGVRSIAVFPLTVAGKVVGVFALYANEVDFFHDEEVKLLNELSRDIAFALDHLNKAEKLNYLAYYDVLTGLANRSLFLERVAQHLRSAASKDHQLALFLIDLERFQYINDSLGQATGDMLLCQVAEWLTHCVGDASLLARLGADHFAVILPRVSPGSDMTQLLEQNMSAFLEHPFRLNDGVFRIAAKVGVAVYPQDGTSAEVLLKNVETTLKKAKASGERFLFYQQAMTETVAAKLTLENQLRMALDRNEFLLHYQPKFHLQTGLLTSAEALIRWQDPRSGLVPPARFIPVLEETGLIFEVGRWALRQAVSDYLRWRNNSLLAVPIAVNVSPLQLRNRGFIAELKQVLNSDINAAAGLELEITESLIMEDIKHSIASLQAIRALGISIAIDDFGTGFSSLSYLAKLPVDTLKIDRSFIVDMTNGPQGLALVSTIINLAHALQLKVVAEGVENEEQSRLLRLLQCDEVQGYLFSKPIPAELFEQQFLNPAKLIVER